MASSIARGRRSQAALQRKVRDDQHVGVGDGRRQLAARVGQRARGRGARGAHPRRPGARGERLGGPDPRPRGHPRLRRIDAGHDAVDVVGGPDRAGPVRHVGDADPDVDRPGGRVGAGLDPPQQAVLLRRHPYVAAADRDRRGRRAADLDPLAGLVGPRVDADGGLAVKHPDLVAGGREPVGFDVDVRHPPPRVRVDARDRAVGVDRPHGAGAHHDPREAPVGEGLAPGQLDRVRGLLASWGRRGRCGSSRCPPGRRRGRSTGRPRRRRGRSGSRAA